MSVTAPITADKEPRGIRIQSSYLKAEVEAPEGIDTARLQRIAQETRERCTISIAIGVLMEAMVNEVATNVTGIVFQDTAHWIPEERPGELAEALVRFLGDHGARSSRARPLSTSSAPTRDRARSPSHRRFSSGGSTSNDTIAGA